MQQHSIWLSISLFCNREYWNILLSKGIKPFIKEVSDQLLLDAHQLEFNYTNGENIRLKLLCDKTKAQLLTEMADSYFKEFFLISNFPVDEIQLLNDELFMPFPTNSIQYGLFPIYNINLKTYQLEIELSLLITEALEENIIDEEIIITLGFYLHIGLFKILKRYNLDSAYQDILQLYTGDISMDSELIYEKYQESREVLTGIYRDVMNNENSDDLLWLKRWIDLCEKEVKSQIVSSNNQLTILVHSRFIFLMHKHLGINKYMDFLLWYFLKQTINENAEIYTRASGVPNINQ